MSSRMSPSCPDSRQHPVISAHNRTRRERAPGMITRGVEKRGGNSFPHLGDAMLEAERLPELVANCTKPHHAQSPGLLSTGVARGSKFAVCGAVRRVCAPQTSTDKLLISSCVISALGHGTTARSGASIAGTQQQRSWPGQGNHARFHSTMAPSPRFSACPCQHATPIDCSLWVPQRAVQSRIPALSTQQASVSGAHSGFRTVRLAG